MKNKVLVLFAALFSFSQPLFATAYYVFGPETYIRGTGAPEVVVNTFSSTTPGKTCLLQFYNGGLIDGEYELVSSSVILFNNQEVAEPNEFNQNVVYLEKTVVLAADNQIDVEVRSKPEGALTLVLACEDDAPPTIEANVVPAPDTGGWHNVSPTIEFICADAESGLASCTDPVTLSNEGANQVVTGVAEDIAGNTATTSVTVNFDQTPPVIDGTVTPAPNASGWNNTDVEVTFSCTDALSGVAECAPPVVVAMEVVNHSVTASATDVAGNSGTTPLSVNIDKTAPVISIASPADHTVFLESPATLIGTVTDVNGPASVTVNGITVAVGAEGQFEHTIALNEGLNTISVLAVDVADNLSQTDLTLTYQANVPPEFTSIPVTVATEDQIYNYQVSVTDGNADDALVLSAPVLPAWLSFDPLTGVLSGTPSNDEVGSHEVRLRVDDGTVYVEQDFVIDVLNVNDAPLIQSTPVTLVTEGERYQYPVVVTDPDVGDGVTFSLDVSPTGMTIDAGTGLLEWLTDLGQVGDYPVTVRATDSGGLFAVQDFVVTVEMVNVAPTANGQTLSTEESIALDVILTADDINNDPLNYQIVRHPDHGRLIGDPPNLIYAPDAYYEGQDSFDFLANDGQFDSAVAAVTIDIVGGNNPPRITSEPVNVHVLDQNVGEPVPQLLSSWEHIGFEPTNEPASNWSFSHDGFLATHGNNGNLSSWLADFDPRDVHIEGTWLVTGTDDDQIGFVLGYQNEYQHYLFQWKKNTQDNSPRGMSLVKYDLAPDGSEGIPVRWGINTTNGEVLYYNDIAWVQNAEYHYSLDLRPGVIAVSVLRDGAVVEAFIVQDDPSAEGRFGIYNHSQAGANYTVSTTSIEAGNNVYWYDVEATDPDGDALTYSLIQAPAGVWINPTTGTLHWDTGVEDAGTYPVVIEVADTHGATSQQAFELVVSEGSAPVITSTPVELAFVDEAYLYPVAAFDPTPNDVLTYSLIESPVGMIIEPQTGLIQWTPNSTVLGAHTVTVEVSDAQGFTGRQTYTLTVDVRPPNDPPVFTSEPLLTATVGVLYSYVVDATDPDGDMLNFGLTGDVPFGMQIFDGRTITWIPGADQIAAHEITVDVRDGNGGSDIQTFTLTVQDLTGNLPPVISSLAPAQAQFDRPYEYAVLATDPDNDPLTYQLDDAPEGMSIDAVTGVVSWLPVSSAIAQHSVRIRVTDDRGGFALQEYVITVSDELANNPPTITSTPQTVTTVSDLYHYPLLATDPDADPLAYTLTTAPLGMSIDSDGLVSWTPAVDQLGQHDIVVDVSDGQGALARQSFGLTVIEANDAPTITSQAVTSAVEGQLYSYSVTATDPDGDSLIFSLPIAPAGMIIDAATGLIQWTPDSTQVGSHNVTVRADDGKGGIAEQSFTISVSAAAVNEPPFITGEPLFTAKAGVEYVYAVQASDPNGDALLYTLQSAPGGMAIDAITGVIQWTPTAADIGGHAVVVRVQDAEFFIDFGWTLTVLDTSALLAVNITADPAVADPGQEVTVTVSAENTAGAFTLGLTVDSIDTALDANGQAVVTFTDIGQHTLVATVTDATGTQNTSLDYLVRDPSDTTPPLVDITTPLTESVITAPTVLTGTVSDDNLTAWQVLISPAGQEHYTEIASGTLNVIDGTLATFDPTLLTNGQWNVIVTAQDAGGHQTSQTVTYTVDGDLKVGNFSFTVLDLEIPVSGIPIRVTRTYDSRRRFEALDFGHGWSVGYQDVKVEESRIPGDGWALNEYPSGPLGLIPLFCVEPLGDPTVTVTLPDGQVERFHIRAAQPCWEATPVLDHQLTFEPADGTLSTLEDSNGPVTLRLVNDHLEFLGESVPYDTDTYTLTTQSGFIYHLDQAFGITSVVDPNGNTLTYTDDGIFHSDGQSVLFNRDAQGRITAVIDPLGNTLSYHHDAHGDLIAVTDPGGYQTDYTYNAEHGLLDIIDPLGRPLIKNIYDDDGRLIAQQDEQGNLTSFDYDLTGNQTLVTDRRGNTTILLYDDRGNITRQIDPLGRLTTYTYDADDNQLSQTDPLGHTTTATYDDRRNQLSQTDALDNTLVFTYNDRGQELTIQDASGDTFTTSYDSLGNLLTVEDPLGNIAGNNIDAKGHVILTQDALGNVTTFTHDDQGNVLTETDPLGHTVTHTYDANGNVLSETRSRTVNGTAIDETTTFDYDEFNRRVKTTDPLGHTTRSEYDALGNQTARIDGRGQRTEFDYDAYRRLTQTTYPDGTTEHNGHDAEGNLTSTTDRAGRTTTYAYDALNRQIRVTHPDGSFSETVYDEVGRVTVEIDQNGHRTEHHYDAAGRRISTTDPLGHTTTFDYDPDGNLISQTDANGHTVSYDYDALDRRTQTTYHDGSFTTETYDALGRLIATTDQANITTQFDYDALGRLTKVTDALNQDTTYSYDEVGNKLTQTDANGHTTTWTYDALGRILSRTLPEGQTETYIYDANSNPISHTDFNGDTTTFDYDLNNRLTSKVYPDQSQETYSHDPIGNRLSATDARGTTTYEYDALNRLIKETQPDGNSIEYTYDNNGNRTQITTTTGATVETTAYSHDALNRLATVTDPNGQITTYGYDPVGNRQNISYPNGHITTYTYDSLNRLTDLETKDITDTVIVRYAYTLAPTGHRTQVTDHAGTTTTYSYDDLYRLTHEDLINHPTLGSASNDYQYDPAGNRTYAIENGLHTAYSYDANDRLLTAGGESYTYDANGNTLITTIDNTLTTYDYDANNRLIQMIKTENGIEIDNVSYQYDIDGLRVAKNEGGITTNYLVDKNRDYGQVLLELDDTNLPIVSYLYGDDLIKQSRAANDSYYLYDGLGSTRALSDEAGAITDTYTYDAYGTLIDSAGVTENSYLYTGEQFDGSLNYYYLRARYYDPANGSGGQFSYCCICL